MSGNGPLTVNGDLNWSRGTIAGSGAVIVNSTLTISSLNSKTLDGRTIGFHLYRAEAPGGG